MQITILVLVYKNIAYLSRTLESIGMQGYSDMELIVSDDDSPDISLDELEQKLAYVRDIPNIRNVVVRKNEKNLGIVAHANKVIGLSRGELIIPLTCGDVFYHSNVVSNIVDFFKENRCLIATGKRECFEEDTGLEIEILPTDSQQKILRQGGQVLIDSLCRGNFISGASTYYSRTLFERYGLFDERMFLIDDYPMYLKLLFAGEKIYFIDEITIKYQLGGVSTGQKNVLFEQDMDTIYHKIIMQHKKNIGTSTYRHLQCRHYYKQKGTIKGWLYCLLFPDVIFAKVLSYVKLLFAHNL